MKFFIFLFLIVSLFNQIGLSEVSFGSLQNENVIKAKTSETVKTIILVWNSGEEDFYLNFSVEKLPVGWDVRISPKEVLLSKNPEGNTQSIIVAGKQFKALKVEIFFKAFDVAKSGEAIIRAVAGKMEGQIPVFQVRDFKFNLVVESSLKEEIKKVENEEGIPISRIILIIFAVFVVLFLIRKLLI